MKNKIYIILLSIFLCTNSCVGESDIGEQPCTNPFDTVDWDFFTDDMIIGSYGDDSSDGSFCECFSSTGDTVAGFRMRISEPISFIEVVDTPYYFPCWQDSETSDLAKQKGRGIRTRQDNSGDKSGGYGIVHFITYPVFAVLNIVMDKICGSSGGIGIPFIGELEPEWYSDFMAVTLKPEVFLFNNPIAALACAYDCVTATADEPTNWMTWCLGCWGSMKGASGRSDGQNEIVDAALLVSRATSNMHRTFRLKQTIPVDMSNAPFMAMDTSDGDDVVCDPPYYPEIIKSQYFYNLSYPVVSDTFAIGEWQMLWQNFKKVPTYPEKIFTQWRRKACCFNILMFWDN